MTLVLRMMLITAGISCLSTIAAAGTSENGTKINGLQFNALTDNGLQFNALTDNGLQFNGLSDNGIQHNAMAANALGGNGSGVAKAAEAEAVQGLFVIGIELPKR
jgi:hypothetical protein